MHDLLRRPFVGDLAVFDENAAIAELGQVQHLVRHQHQRRAFAPQPVDVVHALLLELGIADREHFIEQQDLRFDMDRDANPSRKNMPDEYVRIG